MLPNITAQPEVEQPGVVLHWRTTHTSFVAIPNRELQPIL